MEQKKEKNRYGVKNNLQKLRTYKRYTQKQLSEMAKVNLSYIRMIERLGYCPKYSLRMRISEAIGFSHDAIWEVDDFIKEGANG